MPAEDNLEKLLVNLNRFGGKMIIRKLGAILCALLLGGCSFFAPASNYNTNPLTGGVDTNTSALLNISLPQGLQCYPTHGFITNGAQGDKEGLEILRGNVNVSSAAQSLYDTLKSHGWQLVGALRKDSRALYLYQKQGEYAVLAFRRQGMLTVIEIWHGASLPPGAELPDASSANDVSIAPEEYGPIETSPGQQTEEKWGGLEEREL